MKIDPQEATFQAGPTVSMYFSEPMAELIATDGAPETRPIRRLTPTLFSARSSAVLIRYGGQRELQLLAALRPTSLYYVVDDDLFAAAPGDGLPLAYRRKLVAFRDDALRRILPMVSHVVAPSRAILAGFPDCVGLVLEPAHCHQPAELGHHRREGTFNIVAAGTRSHLRDLSHIAQGLAAFLRETPDARLTTFLGNDAPKPLRGLHNAIHHTPMPWRGYCRFVSEHRFQVALAPGLDTAFNRARSVSKLHDHAGFGAAGLYSDRAPFKGIVRPGQSGLLLGDDPAEWLAGLRQLHRDRLLGQRLAQGGQVLSARHGAASRVRAFWVEALQL